MPFFFVSHVKLTLARSIQHDTDAHFLRIILLFVVECLLQKKRWHHHSCTFFFLFIYHGVTVLRVSENDDR